MAISPKQIRSEPIQQTAQASPPVVTSTSGYFYTKNISGVVEAFYVDSFGREIQLTINGNPSGGGGGGGEANVATNAGTSSDGSPLALTKSGIYLPFRRIKAGTNVSISEFPNYLLVSTTGGGGGGPSTKNMIAGMAIPALYPVSKRTDGKIIVADSDAPQGTRVVGFTLGSASGDGSVVSVLLPSLNLGNALSGLGFTVGDRIYLSETGGYTNDPNSFTNNDDVIMLLGWADCADGIASSSATDLVVFIEEIMSPS